MNMMKTKKRSDTMNMIKMNMMIVMMNNNNNKIK